MYAHGFYDFGSPTATARSPGVPARRRPSVSRRTRFQGRQKSQSTEASPSSSDMVSHDMVRYDGMVYDMT